VDFLLSREGQTLLARYSLGSVRGIDSRIRRDRKGLASDRAEHRTPDLSRPVQAQTVLEGLEGRPVREL